MNPSAANIFDLLLGGSAPTGEAASVTGVDSSLAGVFDQALASLLGGAPLLDTVDGLTRTPDGLSQGQASGGETTADESATVSQFDLLALEQKIAQADGAGLRHSVLDPTLRRYEQSGDAGVKLHGGQSDVALDGKVAHRTAPADAAFTASLQDTMLVPNEAVTRPSIATLAEPIMAESGTYEVQDWQIQGDRITLALTAGEESSEKLTVSLPLEALKATRQGRVSLNPLTADRTAMAQALKLDKVTAISIQVDENTGATEPTTAVKCTLLNDDDASVAVAQLPRSEVKALRVRALDNKRSSESSIQNFKNSLSDSKSPTTAQTTASSIAPKAAESVELARLTQRYGLDTEKVWGMAGKVESGSGGTLSSDQTVQVSAGESTAIESRSDSKATSDLPRQAVVFRLPEKIEKPSSGTTRTLRLSIEPEHLGPARLTLTERNGEMHARVTVPTQEAKSLVEGNLDRLVRQLADADVQLDRLEVALDNQEEEGRFQERPGHSRPKVKPRAEFDINEITTAPSEPTSTAWVPPATEAVAGLDLLA